MIFQSVLKQFVITKWKVNFICDIQMPINYPWVSIQELNIRYVVNVEIYNASLPILYPVIIFLAIACRTTWNQVVWMCTIFGKWGLRYYMVKSSCQFQRVRK